MYPLYNRYSGHSLNSASVFATWQAIGTSSGARKDFPMPCGEPSGLSKTRQISLGASGAGLPFVAFVSDCDEFPAHASKLREASGHGRTVETRSARLIRSEVLRPVELAGIVERQEQVLAL